MCYLCNEIYTKKGREVWLGMAMNTYDEMPYIYKQEEVETISINGEIYNDYYYLGLEPGDFHYDFRNDGYYEYDEKDLISIPIKYCPECGKQLFFSKCFNEPIMNNPKVKKIIIKEK